MRNGVSVGTPCCSCVVSLLRMKGHGSMNWTLKCTNIVRLRAEKLLPDDWEMDESGEIVVQPVDLSTLNW